MKYSDQAPTATSSIQALANNHFVTAENAGASPLVANRTTVGDWEKTIRTEQYRFCPRLTIIIDGRSEPEH
ncbi:hypothetical protein [Paenibacillus sp. yr247]|uniref:fascin domain-containing protein n=1 Tax=Paenibacillus sp. yr247 TaxID=1761880 RepID=UPI0011407D54|nr:hypothetical protein [Paenibacillus sp. yr247]